MGYSLPRLDLRYLQVDTFTLYGEEHTTTIMTAHPTITVKEVSGARFGIPYLVLELILQEQSSQAMNLLDDRRVKSVRPLIP